MRTIIINQYWRQEKIPPYMYFCLPPSIKTMECLFAKAIGRSIIKKWQ